MITRKVISPQLTLVNEFIPDKSIIGTSIYFPLRAGDDLPEQSGLATLTNRLMLSGTKNQTAKELALALEELGTSLNLDVRHDYSFASMQTTTPTWEKGIEILSDCIWNSVLPPEKVNNEKSILLKEIREENDVALNTTFKSLARTLYNSHPYGLPLHGKEDTVKSITRDQILERYQKITGPITITVVGNLDLNHVESVVKSELVNAAKGQNQVKEFSAPMIPDKEKRVVEHRENEAAWITTGFIAPTFADRDFPAMRVIDSILGGGMNSRLFVEVREKRGLAYQVGSVYATRQKAGQFVVYLGTGPQNLDSALECVLDEIENLQTQSIDEEELNRCKTYLCGTFQMGRETNLSHAMQFGLYEYTGVGLDMVEKYPKLIWEVTQEDIKRVASKYLKIPTIAITTP